MTLIGTPDHPAIVFVDEPTGDAVRCAAVTGERLAELIDSRLEVEHPGNGLDRP